MSLSCQVEDWSSLSPGSSRPPAVPRRTSARSRNATADDDVFLTVTVVARSAPSGPACRTVAAVAEMDDVASVRSAFRFAYVVITPAGLSSVLLQSVASCWVDSQYTLRSVAVPFWL